MLFVSQHYLIEEAQRRHLSAAEKEAARDANRRRTAGAGADAAGMPPVEAPPTEAVGEEVAELVELIEQAVTQAAAPAPAEASAPANAPTNILVSELPAKRGGKPSLLVRVLARILRF